MGTASADVSSLIDIASSPSPATDQPVESTVEETPLESTVEETAVEETPEAGEGAAEEGKPEKAVDARTNPAAIRTALKALRDSSPENAPIARELNNIVGRYTAYKDVFPKVADAQSAKAILDAVGGNDGIASLQETIKSVNETDHLLYNGDPTVLDTLIEDFRKEGKLDNFIKFGGPMLDRIQDLNPKAAVDILRPRFVAALEEARFTPAVQSILDALADPAKPNVDAIKSIAQGMLEWFNAEKGQVKNADKTKLDPDRQAFEQERTQFQTEKQKAFEREVNGDWNRENNVVLGNALKPFMKMPFAKNWTDGTKVSVAREVMSTLLEELTADKTYQSQMDAFWSEKNPDKSKIINFHKSKVSIIGPRIVKQVLENRYPGFARTAAAPRPKPAAGGAVTAQPRVAGRPAFVSVKPPMEQIDISKDPDRMLLATGRGYLKNGKFISWNPKDK